MTFLLGAGLVALGFLAGSLLMLWCLGWLVDQREPDEPEEAGAWRWTN